MMDSLKLLRGLLFFFWLSLFTSQSVMDAAASLLFIYAVVRLIQHPEERRALWAKFRSSRLAHLCVGWLLVVAVGIFVVAGSEVGIGREQWRNFLEFRWMLELGLWIYLLSLIRLDERDGAWIVAPPLVTAVFGLLAWVMNASPLHPGEAVGRVGGFFNNPMPFAHTMGPVAAGFAAAWLVIWKERRTPAWGFLLIALVLNLSVLLSMTRGIWIGILAAALVLPPLLWKKRGWILSLSVVVTGVLLAFSVPVLRDRVTEAFDPSRSYDGQRVVLWQTNWRMFLDHPIFGVGYSENRRHLREYYDRMNLPTDQFESHAHNQYLHFLSGTGALGLLCYVLFLGSFLVLNWRLVRRPTGILFEDALAACLLAAQITFYVGSVTESNFSISKNRYLILFVLALVAALKVWRQRRQSDAAHFRRGSDF
ncbi:MAG: O-antigen ligase family protein [Bdellovibrionaceae bacterium]|nr:O-antigen ligase family protein [Pseudobdellovibrionaceae bacterium]